MDTVSIDKNMYLREKKRWEQVHYSNGWYNTSKYSYENTTYGTWGWVLRGRVMGKKWGDKLNISKKKKKRKKREYHISKSISEINKV